MEFKVKEIVKIYIIESPNDSDLLADRKEGLALSETLKLASVKNQYYNVINLNNLCESFEEIAVDLKSENLGAAILHLSMHGNKDGIALTNEQFISWKDLCELLYELNQKVGYLNPFKDERLYPKISLHMSTCEGFNAFVMNDYLPNPVYIHLVGPIKTVNWSDSLIAYATLYHNTIHHRNGIIDAVDRMNVAANLPNIFRVAVAKELELIKK